MDKQQLDEFVKYYCEFPYTSTVSGILDHMYEKFGREFVFNLPVRQVTSSTNSQIYIIDHNSVGPIWHSTTGPAYTASDNRKQYWIINCPLTLDSWLPRSALSPEEQIIYKLKHG